MIPPPCTFHLSIAIASLTRPGDQMRERVGGPPLPERSPPSLDRLTTGVRAQVSNLASRRQVLVECSGSTTLSRALAPAASNASDRGCMVLAHWCVLTSRP
jgi:hypothetical protein